MATVCRWPPGKRGDHFAHARDTRGELAQQRPGAGLHRHLVHLEGVEFLAEEDVRDDVEVLAKGQILEHGRDPECQRGAWIGEGHGLAAEHHGAAARLMHAGEDLDQG